MYTVTFFSFKGGVGRSMALVNIAMDLVSKGRKVVLMDFDLEAPGLSTFGLCEAKSLKGGVVDYVHDYLASFEAPSINEYIAPCNEIKDLPGKLWLIPAGKNDDGYSAKLADINWRDLYRNKSGFLLFEDMKAQIQMEIAPDYLLIDSRTGHTDVGGICTRQLPNSIVFLFFPNEQNLVGLKKICDIVDQENSKRTTSNLIQKHFVTSNVPDLDDENKILADRLVEFSRQLGYENLNTIHRYNSLSLLNQEIFTLKRPNTRLAEEYRNLTRSIILENPEDNEGAYNFLISLIEERKLVKLSPAMISERIERISEKHGNNPELSLLISRYKEQLGDYESALRFISSALDSGYREPEALLRLAKLSIATGAGEQAIYALESFLQIENVSFSDLSLAINLILRVKSDALFEVISSPAFLALDPSAFRAILESHFMVDEKRVELVEAAIENATAKNRSVWNADNTRIIYALVPICKIALGQFDDALRILSNEMASGRLDVGTAFNYAMADWGVRKKPNRALFNDFIKIASEFDFDSMNANFKQCCAIAYWVLGKEENAIELARIAQQQAKGLGVMSFSCWTYLYRSPRDFSSDVNEMIKMFKGGGHTPRVYSKGQDDLFSSQN